MQYILLISGRSSNSLLRGCLAPDRHRRLADGDPTWERPFLNGLCTDSAGDNVATQAIRVQQVEGLYLRWEGVERGTSYDGDQTNAAKFLNEFQKQLVGLFCCCCMAAGNDDRGETGAE